MLQLQVGSLQLYIFDWIVYLIKVLFWAQAGFLAVLLVFQMLAEADRALRYRVGKREVMLRFAMSGLFLFLFVGSLAALAGTRLVISPQVHWGFGLAAVGRGAYDRAVLSFEKAEFGGLDTPDFHLGYAEALFRIGRNREALLEVRRCSRESVQKEMIEGRIDFALGRYVGSEQAFRSVLKRDPGNRLALAWLGETYLKLNRPAEAAQALRKVLANPDLPAPLRNRIENLLRSAKGKP